MECRSENQEVVISIRDQGVGIPTDELPRIFQRYFRARTSVGIAGTGIGLNLVKQLVEMHGGSISVESTEGEGSTFTLRLPFRQAVAEPAVLDNEPPSPALEAAG